MQTSAVMLLAIAGVLLGNPVFARDDALTEKQSRHESAVDAETLMESWITCLRNAADTFAPQPKPVETILVRVWGVCATQENALMSNYAELTGGKTEEARRTLRDSATQALTARILTDRAAMKRTPSSKP